MDEIFIKGSVENTLELYPELTFGAAMENSIAALEKENMPLAAIWLTVAEKLCSATYSYRPDEGTETRSV